MRFAGVWLCAALGVGPVALAQTPQPEVRTSETRSSANGTIGVRWVESPGAPCAVEAVAGTQSVWKLEQCLGSLDDFLFINNAGDKLWVLVALPKKPPGKKARASWWAEVEVARLYTRTGELLQRRTLKQLLPARKKRLGIRETPHRLQWLEGFAGVPGQAPRLTEDGAVEFDIIGRHTVRLTF